MSNNDVIRAGDFSLVERYQNIIGIDSGDLVVLILFVVIMTSFAYVAFLNVGILMRYKFFLKVEASEKLRLKPESIIDLFLPIIMVCTLMYSVSFSFILDEDGQSIQNWTRHYAHPYIESLPVKTVKLEAVDRVEHAPAYITNKDQEKAYVPVSVIYANEKGLGVTLDTKALVVFDVKDGSPYMEYKQVDKDLGHGYDKGFYNPVIHLPTGYYINQ